jgi:hypothetical protein
MKGEGWSQLSDSNRRPTVYKIKPDLCATLREYALNPHE